jgi:predicted hydrocarbon binding protein
LWTPVHLSDHYYDPNRDYCGFYVISTIALPSFGPTAELIKVFDERGVILVTITSHHEEGLVKDFVIADLTGRKHLREDLERAIRAKFGKKLIFFESADTGIPGFIYNIRGFPLVFNFSGDYIQSAALSADSWRTLLRGTIQRFGSNGLMILWHMGDDAGENEAKLLTRLKSVMSCPERIKIALARLQSLGWGRFELAECDPDGRRIVIRVYDNFEDTLAMDLENYQSSFLRGYLVGLVSVLFARACRGVEAKCIARGDEFCEFVIR